LALDNNQCYLLLINNEEVGVKKSLMIVMAIVVCVCCSSVAVAQTYTVAVNQLVEHPALDAVSKGIQDYLKDKGVAAEFKIYNAQGKPATAAIIAGQMVGGKYDLHVAIATPSAQACYSALQKAPKNLKRPLVFTAITDPVSAGLVKDLNNPGGNVTGVSDLLPVKKHLEMILEFKPDTKKVGVLYNAGEANSKSTVEDLKKFAKELGLKIVQATASTSAEVYQASKSLVGRADVVFIPTDNTIVSALESVTKIGIQNKLPVFASDVDSVRRGCVAAIGFDYYKHGYQTGAMIEKILKGTPPSDIPVEFQKDLQLQINMKSADLMGVLPPQSAVDRATKIYK
jgi:putative ABC transport system substrate-binding protein